VMYRQCNKIKFMFVLKWENKHCRNTNKKMWEIYWNKNVTKLRKAYKLPKNHQNIWYDANAIVIIAIQMTESCRLIKLMNALKWTYRSKSDEGQDRNYNNQSSKNTSCLTRLQYCWSLYRHLLTHWACNRMNIVCHSAIRSSVYSRSPPVRTRTWPCTSRLYMRLCYCHTRNSVATM
jgi:hypothetical protein